MCIEEIDGRCDDTFVEGEAEIATGGEGLTGFAMASSFTTASMTEDTSSH